MYLRAKSYKKVFKYDLLNTLKFIRQNDILIRGKYSHDLERLAMIASEHNSINVLKYLIDEMDLDISFDEDHILKDALFYEYYDLAKYAIKNGADIKKCSTSFLDACIIGNCQIVSYMFDKGFVITYEGNESICYTCENGHLTLLKYLLEKGATIGDLVLKTLEDHSNKDCYEYLKAFKFGD